ncbi:hypothetical protein GCM10022416_55330 [Actinomadura keratinilytica]|uniref:Transcriptional regulator n=2 Tax=Actinomadura keratinilytica TaxID=547461 RepID=A0ABP7ZEI3_9ACTN
MPPDVRPLSWALSRMTPGLWAALLPGETLAEARARREAAADILDDLFAEYDAAGEVAEGVSA